MNLTIRQRFNNLLEINFRKRKGLSFYVNIGLSALIFSNTVAIILHTVPSFKAKYDHLFQEFELFSVSIFTVEYLLRLWSCVEQKEYKHPFWGRLKYMFSAWGLVDLLAIVPFYFSYFSTDTSFVRILRLLRILRLFRVSRYFHALRVIQKVVLEKKEELLLSMSFIIFLLLISSGLVYYIEHEVQPVAFGSIPDAMWWCVNAMTTVGYGDVHPITPLGKILGGIISILGVSIFALPTSILASGFAKHVRVTPLLNEKKEHAIKCPHCDQEIVLHQPPHQH
jgi:voltage-gated potassium channel